MTVPLWQSWSEFGRICVSTVLKIPADGVIPTTNHLESFNAILKKKHLAELLHSGHQLRFDSLVIHLLITQVLLDIFKNRKTHTNYNNWLAFRFHEKAGGNDLVEAHISEAKERNARRKAPLCWWVDNNNRDNAAKEIISTGKIKISHPNGNGYTATCTPTSSHETGTKHQFLEYDLHCNRNGDAACSCPDFQTHGRACKHLRALRLAIEHWISQQLEMPFYFPSSCEEAKSLQWIESCSGSGGVPVPQVVTSA
jgi:hypothetical protein